MAKKKRRWPWVVGCLAMLGALGSVAAWELRGFGLGSRIAASEYKRLEAAGWPLDTSKAIISPIDHAVGAQLKALAEEADGSLKPRGAKETLLQWANRRKAELAADYAPAFASNPVDPEDSFLYLSELRAVVKGLGAAAVEAARAGDRATMNRCLKQGASLAKSLDGNEWLFSVLVQIALDAILKRSALDCLAVRPTWERDVAWLGKPITPIEVQKTIQQEASFGLGSLRSLRFGSPGDFRFIFEGPSLYPANPIRPVPGAGLPSSPVFRAAAGHLLRGYREASELLDAEGRPKDRATFRQDARSLEARLAGAGQAASFANMVVPVILSGADSYNTQRFREGSFSVVLRAIAFRNQRGRWPSDKELGRLPEDPFAPGTELQYKVQGDNIAVWTVGAKGTSDPMLPSQPADVTWFPENPTQTAPSP